MDLEELQQEYLDFIKERNWSQFHQPKSIAMSISIESAELMEIFQWKDNLESDEIREDTEVVGKVREELADIILYCLSLANELEIDLLEAVSDKLDENHDRFDEETSGRITRDLEKWKK